MAIIGQSLNSGLYQRVTEEGSKYRDLKYSDVSNTEPLISGYHKTGDPALTSGIPGVKEEAGGTGILSDVQRAVTARLDDTARIGKLLLTKQGIKWEAHNAELAAIQKNLESKRGQYSQGSDVEGGFWNTVLGQTLRNVGQGLLDTARVTAETLAQTAVAGTGEHFTAWYDRTYLKSNITLESLFGMSSAAADALATGHVTIHTTEDGSPELDYRQLPVSDTEILEQAQAPKRRETSLTGSLEAEVKTTVAGNIRQFYGRTFGGEKLPEYLDFFSTEDPERTDFKTGSEDIAQEQAPTPGRFVNYTAEAPEKTGIELGKAEQGAWRYTSGPDYDYLNGNRYSEAESYIEDANLYLESQAAGNKSISRIAQTVDETSGSHNLESTDPTKWSGPWRPDGAQTLIAGKVSKNNNANYQHDGGQTVVEVNQSTKMPVGSEVDTRVDNGRIDMIPFWIRAITADGAVDKNAYLFFEANLDSYSDNYDASWEGIQYIGRADKFWNYNGFDRQISFSFKMVAHTKSHLKPIYNRLNGLLSMTAPSYGNKSAFMQGVLAEITIGDLLHNQLGFIKSVGLKWETDYMWELDDKTIIVPHVLDVSVGFTPIHQFVPQIQKRYFELVGDESKGTAETFIVNYEKLYKKQQ